MTDAEKRDVMIDKINKLLRKAESTTSLEEAEVFFAKAQELMTSYQIDQALLSQANPVRREQIINKAYRVRGIFRDAILQLAYNVVLANKLKAVRSNSHEYSESGKQRKIVFDLHIYGHESDVESTLLLIASLEVQAVASMVRWWNEYDRFLDRQEAFNERRSFIYGFASRIAQRLREARAETVKTYAAPGVPIDKNPAAIVLVSREKEVEQYFEDKFAHLKSRKSQGRQLYGTGLAAGRRAADSANIGQPGLKNRGKLGP